MIKNFEESFFRIFRRIFAVRTFVIRICRTFKSAGLN